MSDQIHREYARADRSKRSAAEARRIALIHHTRALMRQNGIQNVSLNEVVRLTGGSKATIVKYFGNKDGLLAAALEESAREIIGPLLHIEEEGDGEFAPALTRVLAGLLRFYLQPEALATYRGVIASAGSSDALARIFYRWGHEVVVEEVASFLSRWSGRGVRDDINVFDAAGCLVQMVRSGLYEQTLLGLQSAPSEPDIEAVASRTAKLFLEGAGVRP